LLRKLFPDWVWLWVSPAKTRCCAAQKSIVGPVTTSVWLSTSVWLEEEVVVVV
jgi:hypothetical protein